MRGNHGGSNVRSFTDDKARAIREQFDRGAGLKLLGRRNGVSPLTIRKLVIGLTYKNAGGPISDPGHRLCPHCKQRIAGQQRFRKL